MRLKAFAAVYVLYKGFWVFTRRRIKPPKSFILLEGLQFVYTKTRPKNLINVFMYLRVFLLFSTRKADQIKTQINFYRLHDVTFHTAVQTRPNLRGFGLIFFLKC